MGLGISGTSGVGSDIGLPIRVWYFGALVSFGVM